jgi:regulator of cell morphogenesis and NO signaling
MSDLTIDRTLAEIVNTEPGATRVLESFGLDYCCGGGRRLDVACSSIGVDPAEILEAIADLGPAPTADWASMGPLALVDHVESTHHAYLHTELERLDELLDKVADAHGARHVELDGIGATYRLLRADLEPHLQKEERVLFPMIRELASATERPTFHCGSISNPITVMMAEHDRAGELLESLRRLTGDYTAPADGCASYRALFDGLALLESDTHLHVHKENNLLFPAVVELEGRWTGAASS